MGIFSRKPPAERPARPQRVRVRLTREESRLVNQLKPLERRIGYGLAAGGAMLGGLQAGLRDDLTTSQRIGLAAVMLALALAMAACARFANRLALQMASVAWVFVLGIVAIVYLGFFMFLTFRSSNDRRKLMMEKAATGHIQAVTAQQQSVRKRSAADVDDRGFALPSARYTPPKHKPKPSSSAPAKAPAAKETTKG